MAMTTVRIIRFSSCIRKVSLLSSSRLQLCAPISTSTSCAQVALRKIVPNEGFWDKNERMQRPLSPHIFIYKFPLSAIMSITHRITGSAMSGVIAAVGVGALVLPGDFSSYIDLIKSLNLPIWALAPVKLMFVYPFTYHTINGVRHMIWDTGYGLDTKSINATGAVIIGASLISAIGIVAYFS